MNENYIISLKNLTKDFGGNVVVNDFNLDIKKGQFVTFLGPSGCGKTTTLRMIAGFEKPSSGEVLFGGENIENLPPHKRNVNTVFQKYALFPHLNVFGNVAFGLKLKRIEEQFLPKKYMSYPKVSFSDFPEVVETRTVNLSKAVIEQKVKRALKIVGLSDYEKRDVASLSGGQQQRVAIARAIVNEPEILLLDEPLGALDLKMRQEMQLELKQMHRQLGITFIYVTHDQEEALTMSDTIVVMRDGLIYQVGTPTDIYNEPKNAFVADFIGESNIFDGVMPESKKVAFCGVVTDCVDEGFEYGKPVDVVIRPEDFILKQYGKGDINGEVTNVIFKGVHYEITLKANDFEFLIHNTKKAQKGDKLGISVDPFDIHIMEKELYRNEFEVEFDSDANLYIGKAKYGYNPSVLFQGTEVPADLKGKKAVVAVEFTGIDLADSEDDAPMAGNIDSMIYKGKNYLVNIRVDDTLRVVADTKYLWDDGDRVGINIPESGFRLVRFLDESEE